jgi:ribose transport system substrate-binding protein
MITTAVRTNRGPSRRPRWGLRRVYLLGTVAAAVAIAAVVALVATGCSAVDSGSSSSTASGAASNAPQRSTVKTIGFDYPLDSLAVYGDLKRFAEAEAAKRGYKLMYTADNYDVQKQNQNVQAWVTQKIPAIVTYPLEPAAMEALAQQAMANGTVVVSYAAPLQHQDASILFSGTESGIALGKNAATWANSQSSKNEVLVLNDNDLAIGKQRYDGLMKTFPSAAKNAAIISDQKAATRQEGEKITRQILQAHPNLNMVLAYDDDVALGAMQAFINAGRDPMDPSIYIGGQDGSLEGLQAVAKGGIYRCSVAVRIRDIGTAVVDVPADILEGKPNKGINVPAVPLTAADPLLKEYLSDYGK